MSNTTPFFGVWPLIFSMIVEKITCNSLSEKISAFLKTRGLELLHQNINGLVDKMDKIKLFLLDSKNKIHLYCISETHTNNTVTNSQIDVPGYNIERKDRVNGIYGGVLCYIIEDLNYQRRYDLEVEGLEVIWIELFIQSTKSILICTIYKPPDNSKYVHKDIIK